MEDLLISLEEDMESSLEEDLFFFPRYKGVKGFYGTGPVWFMCQKPSTAGFPTYHDDFFYSKLREYGLNNAHLTDISKLIGQATPEIPKPELRQNRPYLQRELGILQPKLLVTVGDSAKKAVNLLPEMNRIPQAHIRHYSWASRFGRHDAFDDNINNVVQKANKYNIDL